MYEEDTELPRGESAARLAGGCRPNRFVQLRVWGAGRAHNKVPKDKSDPPGPGSLSRETFMGVLRAVRDLFLVELEGVGNSVLRCLLGIDVQHRV